MKVVRMGSGRIHKFDTDLEATAFVEGFHAALKEYGQWFEGVQFIGPLATPIKNITLNIYEQEVSKIIEEEIIKKEIKNDQIY
jgi:hypothetical protein